MGTFLSAARLDRNGRNEFLRCRRDVFLHVEYASLPGTSIGNGEFQRRSGRSRLSVVGRTNVSIDDLQSLDRRRLQKHHDEFDLRSNRYRLRHLRHGSGHRRTRGTTGERVDSIASLSSLVRHRLSSGTVFGGEQTIAMVKRLAIDLFHRQEFHDDSGHAPMRF